MPRRALPEPAREIDLHGLDVPGALARLRSELAFCRARGISPLLVITGRGLGSPGGRAVLGPAVRSWLTGRAGRAAGVVECRSTSRGGALWIRLASRGG